MASLQGLKGLIPDPQISDQVMDEGVLEARANAPAAEHGAYGSQHYGYSGSVPTDSPFSGFSVYDGYDPAYVMEYGAGGQVAENRYGLQTSGTEYDETPTTHSSPSPRVGLSTMIAWGNPDGAALVGNQMTELHGPELGGVRFNVLHDPVGREEETHYTTEEFVAPNESYLSTASGQLKSGTLGGGPGGGRSSGAGGGSNADPDQGYGVNNTMPEFNAGHSIRRIQHDRMPWDFTATHGEQNVPFMGRHPIEQNPLNGPDSPYFEQGSIDGANVAGPMIFGDPTQYVQPVEPDIAPTPLPQADYYPVLAF